MPIIGSSTDDESISAFSATKHSGAIEKNFPYRWILVAGSGSCVESPFLNKSLHETWHASLMSVFTFYSSACVENENSMFKDNMVKQPKFNSQHKQSTYNSGIAIAMFFP